MPGQFMTVYRQEVTAASPNDDLDLADEKFWKFCAEHLDDPRSQRASTAIVDLLADLPAP
jgi:hypothetical protein